MCDNSTLLVPSREKERTFVEKSVELAHGITACVVRHHAVHEIVDIHLLCRR